MTFLFNFEQRFETNFLIVLSVNCIQMSFIISDTIINTPKRIKNMNHKSISRLGINVWGWSS